MEGHRERKTVERGLEDVCGLGAHPAIYTYSKGLGMQCAAGNGNEQPPENFSHFGAGPVRPAADDARTASHGLRDPRDSRH